MIVLPKGSHPEELSGDHSFLDWVKDASLQQPLDTSRTDAGARIDRLMAALNAAVAEYRKAVVAENGTDNAEARISLAVKNSARRAGLGPVLGLS